MRRIGKRLQQRMLSAVPHLLSAPRNLPPRTFLGNQLNKRAPRLLEQTPIRLVSEPSGNQPRTPTLPLEVVVVGYSVRLSLSRQTRLALLGHSVNNNSSSNNHNNRASLVVRQHLEVTQINLHLEHSGVSSQHL